MDRKVIVISLVSSTLAGFAGGLVGARVGRSHAAQQTRIEIHDQRVVTARTIRVTNEAGIVRAQLRAETEFAALTLHDETGIPVASFGIRDRDSSITVDGETYSTGEKRVRLRLGETGTNAAILLEVTDQEPHMMFADQEGKTRLSALAARDGEAYLCIAGRKSGPSACLRTTNDDRAQLGLWGQSARGDISLTASATGPPRIAILDTGANARAMLALTESGDGDFRLFDQSGMARAALIAETEYSHLLLRDSAGRVRLSANVDEVGSSLSLRDAAGETRAVLGQTSLVMRSSEITEGRPESSLVLFGADGTVAHKVP